MTSQFFAVVAGAVSGTGRAVAVKISRAYAIVLLACRESYVEVVIEINTAGGKAVGISTDAADESSLASLSRSSR